jgi:hypothetical protein
MELRIDKYINELLFDHNCVIIPSFGGFVGNYKGAEIHPTQHIFSAPCKQLGFNKNLNINDGLLANKIVLEEKITYAEALEIIDRDVFKIKNLLSSGEKVELKSIGYLRIDVERNIQFSPNTLINHASSSFGLQSFQSSAIKRGGFVTEVGKTFKDRPAIKAKSNFKKYKKYALPLLVLPVAIGLFLFPFSSVVKDKIQLQTSGFFNNNNIRLYQPETHSFNLPLAEITPMKIIEEKLEQPSIEEYNKSFAVEETTKVVNAVVHEQSITPEGAYTLISGCFAILENAEKHVAQLKLKNINANIIGKTKSGLYRVGCGNYESAIEANQALLNIKSIQTDVWVLKN